LRSFRETLTWFLVAFPSFFEIFPELFVALHRCTEPLLRFAETFPA
jgi:hypothetical protein